MPVETFIADKDPSLFVAHAILAQLGGARFRRMTRTHSFVGHAGNTAAQPYATLQMQLGAGVREGRHRLLVTLLPGGCYRMEFYTPRYGEQPTREQLLTYEPVAGPELAATFTKATGFYTSLHITVSQAEWLERIRVATATQALNLSIGTERWLREFCVGHLRATHGTSPEFEEAAQAYLSPLPT